MNILLAFILGCMVKMIMKKMCGQNIEGLEKIILGENTQEDIATADLQARHPEAMTELLGELPSSKRESGWNPELKVMRKNAQRWHMM